MPIERTHIGSPLWMSGARFHHSLAQKMFLESPQSAEASARGKVIPREGAVKEM